MRTQMRDRERNIRHFLWDTPLVELQIILLCQPVKCESITVATGTPLATTKVSYPYIVHST